MTIPEPNNFQKQDEAAIEAVLRRAAGEACPVTDHGREARIDAWLKILAAAPAPAPRGDLLERTLAAVNADLPEDTADEPLPFVRPLWQRRVAEFAAMAVAASIFLAVLFVGMNQAKLANGRVACAESMQKTSKAFADYALAQGGELPGLGTPADRNWLKSTSATGAHSNAGNLLPLLDGRYLAVANLVCPGNPTTPGATANDLVNIGYSYTYLYGTLRPKWDGRHETPVLSDKNPMFVPGATTSAAMKNSPNHGERGNYLLRGDGSVSWESSPFAGPGGDNLWTLTSGGQQLLTYTGAEYPARPGDLFMAP